VLENIHRYTSHCKTQHGELQDVPESLEIFAFLLFDLLNRSNKEVESEAAVENLEENHNDCKSANITL